MLYYAEFMEKKRKRVEKEHQNIWGKNWTEIINTNKKETSRKQGETEEKKKCQPITEKRKKWFIFRRSLRLHDG